MPHVFLSQKPLLCMVVTKLVGLRLVIICLSGLSVILRKLLKLRRYDQNVLCLPSAGYTKVFLPKFLWLHSLEESQGGWQTQLWQTHMWVTARQMWLSLKTNDEGQTKSFAQLGNPSLLLCQCEWVIQRKKQWQWIFCERWLSCSKDHNIALDVWWQHPAEESLAVGGGTVLRSCWCSFCGCWPVTVSE